MTRGESLLRKRHFIYKTFTSCLLGYSKTYRAEIPCSTYKITAAVPTVLQKWEREILSVSQTHKTTRYQSAGNCFDHDFCCFFLPLFHFLNRQLSFTVKKLFQILSVLLTKAPSFLCFVSPCCYSLLFDDWPQRK